VDESTGTVTDGREYPTHFASKAGIEWIIIFIILEYGADFEEEKAHVYKHSTTSGFLKSRGVCGSQVFVGQELGCLKDFKVDQSMY